jgi:hypothetical protein
MNRKSITAFVVALSLFTVAGGQHMLADAGQGGIGGLQLPNRRVCSTNGDTKNGQDSCPVNACDNQDCAKYSWTTGNSCQAGNFWDNCTDSGTYQINVIADIGLCTLSGSGCGCIGVIRREWVTRTVTGC